MCRLMKNKYTNQILAVKEGFSWTTLFFGFLVPVFRGDLLFAFIMFITAFLTGGISILVFPFFYNRIYITRLYNRGYRFIAKRKELSKEEKDLRSDINKRTIKITLVAILWFLATLILWAILPPLALIVSVGIIITWILLLIANMIKYIKTEDKLSK